MASEDYVHPIIQAMQFAAQRADAQKQTAFERDLRQQELQQRQQEHADEFGLQEKNLALLQQKQKLDLETHNLNTQEFIKKFFSEGGQPTSTPSSQSFIPTITNPTPPQDLSVGGIPVSQQQVDAYRSLPEAEFNRQFGNFKQQKDYEQNQAMDLAAQKAGLERETQRRQLDLEHTNRLGEIAANGINTDRVAQTNHQNDIELENMRGYFQLAAARIAHQQGQEDLAPTIKNAFDGVLNGQTTYSALPKDIKEGVSKLAGSQNWTLPTNQKDFSTKVDSADKTEQLLNQAQDLALKYSRDGKQSSFLNYIPGKLSGNVPFTDLKASLDEFKSNGGALVKAYEGMSRTSEADIIRNVVGLFDPNATVEQNLAKIEEKRSQLNQVIKNTFAGMPDSEVNYILKGRGINNLDVKNLPTGKDSTSQQQIPNWLSIAPKTNKNGTPLDTQKSLELGHPVYGR